MSSKSELLQTEKEIKISAPWGHIAGLTWGNPANPPVLMVHGKMHAASVFRPLVTLLPPNFHYVAIDLPGNGRSSHFPRGLKNSFIDFVPSIYLVVQHFEWRNFIYIGHSLGVVVGKLFNLSYPGHITGVVEFDPVPAHHVWEPEDVGTWYRRYYHTHYVDKYNIVNSEKETAPSYTYDDILKMFENVGLNNTAAGHLLERILEPAGDGLYRFTYDQRMKDIPTLPFSSDSLRRLYTQINTPTLCILAKKIVDLGIYRRVPFVTDVSAWKNNYEFKIVDGGHDVHITHPHHVAGYVSKFLLGFKSKL